MADPAAASARAVDDVTDEELPGLPAQPDLTVRQARAVAAHVDHLAQAEMEKQGRNPTVWDRLDEPARDGLRVAALRRARGARP